MILIIDFGSQYNQLIARRVRESRVYCQIEPPTVSVNTVKSLKPEGIILSGGPSSIYEKNSPKIDREIFGLGIPVLGICYGMQLACEHLGGKVESTNAREYGRAICEVASDDELFKDFPTQAEVWMSHADQVQTVSDEFKSLARTDSIVSSVLPEGSVPILPKEGGSGRASGRC